MDRARWSQGSAADSDPPDRKGSGGGHAANQRHIKTEQKRRDRINEGFSSLQALLPVKEKVEKASMLSQAADYIKTLQDLMQQIMDCGAITALSSEQQFTLRLLLPRKSGDQAPAPPPATRSAAASAPATAPQLGAPGFGAAAPGLEQMDPALMSQIQLQMQMPFLLAAMQAFPGTSMPYGVPAAQPFAAQGGASLLRSSTLPHPTLIAPKASMGSPASLQQLVDAASLVRVGERAESGFKAPKPIKADNKENGAPRKRGRELTETIAPPQPKQARCYYAGPEVDFASLPDFII